MKHETAHRTNQKVKAGVCVWALVFIFMHKWGPPFFVLQKLNFIYLLECVGGGVKKKIIAPNYWLQLYFEDSFLSVCQSVRPWHEEKSSINLAARRRQAGLRIQLRLMGLEVRWMDGQHWKGQPCFQMCQNRFVCVGARVYVCVCVHPR